MWKVKNITKDSRKFREYKTGELHFLRSGEEVIISNKPATERFDVFKITDLELNKKETEESTIHKDREEKSIKQRKIKHARHKE
jgi:hypothetical protein